MKFNKHNLLLRDLYTCQYCSETFNSKELTIDHVIPISLGGKTSWNNCVTACSACNSKKGNKLWKPKRLPSHPDYWKLVTNAKRTVVTIHHPSWESYLGINKSKQIMKTA
jgi:5-methylcytosine-specific restriction endonuclease McrA